MISEKSPPNLAPTGQSSRQCGTQLNALECNLRAALRLIKSFDMSTTRYPAAFFFGLVIWLAMTGYTGVSLLLGGDYEPSMGRLGTFKFTVAVATIFGLIGAASFLSLAFWNKLEHRTWVVGTLAVTTVTVTNFVAAIVAKSDRYREIWYYSWVAFAVMCFASTLVSIWFAKPKKSN